MENWTDEEGTIEKDNSKPVILADRDSNINRRHGCVITWLIALIVGNAIVSWFYITRSEMMAKIDGLEYLKPEYYQWSGYIGLITFFGAVLLFLRRKLGFHLVAISAMCNAALLYSVNRIWLDAVVPFIGVAVLYWILQITRDGETAWRQLE